MSTTIDDIHYEQHLEDLHNSYTSALEKLAESRSLSELQENLEELQGAKASLPDWMTKNENQFFDLEEALEEVAQVEKIYELLIEQKRQNKVYFVIGLIIGTTATILSSLFL